MIKIILHTSLVTEQQVEGHIWQVDDDQLEVSVKKINMSENQYYID